MVGARLLRSPSQRCARIRRGSLLVSGEPLVGKTSFLRLLAQRLARVLETLSQFSGLPVSMLDTREQLDLKSIRDFFTARVIGQDEAVDAMIARIAMLKAGLNDPNKPTGVFLLAGPTGTGKTELAKAVSEFLFGSV